MSSITTAVVVCIVVLTAVSPTARAGTTTIVETFEGGSNEGGWTWGAGDTVPPNGGNSGAYLRTNVLDTFAPQPRTTAAVSEFTGDYRQMGVTQIGVDLNTFAVDFSAADRPCTLMLIHDNGTPGLPADDTAAYFMGPDVPLEGQGWISYSFTIPAQDVALPPGWLLLNLGDSGAPANHSWDQVIQDVDVVKFFYGDPTFVFIFQMWQLGLDNPSITKDGAAPCLGDVNGSGAVDVNDLLDVLAAWGTCVGCPEDINGDDRVTVVDLLQILADWGGCRVELPAPGTGRYHAIDMRVVSLLPSATEILCAIEGGAAMLVGRSHECDHPASIGHLPLLTGQRTAATNSAEIDRQVRDALGDDAIDSLYTLDADLLGRLAPDVILTQDLCDVCSIDLAAVRRLAADLDPPPRIVSLNPVAIEDLFEDVLRVGEAVGLEAGARRALASWRERYWSAVDHVNPYVDGPEVAFLEWMDPLFVGGHWTPQLIEAAGARHSLNPPGAPSRQVTAEQLVASRPDRLIICPCGYDLAAIGRELETLRARPWWGELPAVRDGAVVMVDGNQMFNRPGPRLVDAFRWLVGWINDRPELVPAGFPFEPAPA